MRPTTTRRRGGGRGPTMLSWLPGLAALGCSLLAARTSAQVCSISTPLTTGSWLSCSSSSSPPQTCSLDCPPGSVADGATADTCAANGKWKVGVAANTECAPPVAVVVGGTDVNGDYLTSVEIVAPNFPKCHGNSLADFPVQISGAFGGFVNGQLMVCGGVAFSSSQIDCVTDVANTSWCTGPKQSSCYSYEFSASSWSPSSPKSLSSPRSHAPAVVNASSLVVVGGATTGALLATSSWLDAFSAKWVSGPSISPTFSATYGAAAARLDDGGIVYAGGFGNGSYHKEAQFLRWKQSSSKWTHNSFSDLNSARANHACTAFVDSDQRQKVLCAGGRSEKGSLSSCEVYDPSTDSWATSASAADLPSPVSGASLVVLGDTPALVGGVKCSGANAADCARTTDVLYLNTATGKWTLAAFLSTARSDHATVLVPADGVPGCL